MSEPRYSKVISLNQEQFDLLNGIYEAGKSLSLVDIFMRGVHEIIKERSQPQQGKDFENILKSS